MAGVNYCQIFIRMSHFCFLGSVDLKSRERFPRTCAEPFNGSLKFYCFFWHDNTHHINSDFLLPTDNVRGIDRFSIQCGRALKMVMKISLELQGSWGQSLLGVY